jgi:hypothetical protein
MTDVSHWADGYPPDELPEFPETAEPEFGSVDARPSWPGVARPAGWFLPAPEEAAPSGMPGTEPARPDTPDSAPATHEHADLDERPTVTPWQPPVVGPTESLRGRAGGPGFVVPAGLVPGIHDPENRSGWLLAHDLWQDSGIDWDGQDARDGEVPPSWAETASPLAAPTVFSAFNPASGPESADATADGADDELPRRRARPQRPEAADLPPQDATPEWEQWQLPEHPDELNGERDDEPGQQAGHSWEQADAEEPDARQPSREWQQAERQVDGLPRPRPWQVPDEQQPRAWHPSDEGPDEYYAQDQPGYRLQDQPAPGRSAPGQPAPGQPAPGRPFTRPWQDRPLDVRQPWEDEPPARPVRGGRPARGGARPRRVWQAARVGVPVVLIAAVGGGALVLLTGKAHGVLASSGSLGPASQPPVVATAAGKGGTGTGSAPTAMTGNVAFPGYPGLRGKVQVTAIATDGTTQLAVGSADSHAAIWRRDDGGPWTLLKKRPGLPTGTVLTGIAHGPAGWLAVGNLSSNGEPSTATLASVGHQPVVLTSTDGVTWKSAIHHAAFAGPDFTVNAVAAGPAGYVVVGEQTRHGMPVDAMWFTPDLVSWTRGGDSIASTVSSLSSGMSDSKIFAVAATATGFVAVGSHNGCHTAWVTTDGRHWLSYDIPKPTGSQDPLLNHVAVMGKTVVASGDLGVKGSRIPLIVDSTDGGVHWQATAIGYYSAFAGPRGTVTALSADGSGFTAAGLTGAPGAQHAVTWTSANGRSWSAAMPAARGIQRFTALAPAGSPATSIASVTTPSGTTSIEVTGPAS